MLSKYLGTKDGWLDTLSPRCSSYPSSFSSLLLVSSLPSSTSLIVGSASLRSLLVLLPSYPHLYSKAQVEAMSRSFLWISCCIMSMFLCSILCRSASSLLLSTTFGLQLHTLQHTNRRMILRMQLRMIMKYETPPSISRLIRLLLYLNLCCISVD